MVGQQYQAIIKKEIEGAPTKKDGEKQTSKINTENQTGHSMVRQARVVFIMGMRYLGKTYTQRS